MGFLAFVVAVAVIHAQILPLDLASSALGIMVFTAMVIFLTDFAGGRIFGWYKALPQDDYRSSLSWSRTFCKLTGFVATLAVIGFFYWLFPEYHGGFYEGYYEMLRMLLPFVAVLAIPYIAYTDRRMRDPYDGFWQMGQFTLLRLKNVNWAVLAQHWLGWTIKAFFLPLMFIYLCSSLEVFMRVNFSALTSFGPWFDFIYSSCYFLDVALCALGYLFALRLAGTHIRSAEPTMQGWVVALVCYQPFYSLVQSQYLNSGGSDYSWSEWLGHSPVLYCMWGCVILLLTAIYVWATVMFGARFSNLTHRGIITNGPYRFTKHPAYIAKNLSWWMVSVPFLATDNVEENIRQCVALLLLNGVYWLRAITEERHLMHDPVYVTYAENIREHGLLRFLNCPKEWVLRTLR